MIRGKFIDRKVIIPVKFLLSAEAIFSVNFILDTGFNGYLTLPANAVTAMNLPLFSTTTTVLADGTSSLIPTHIATIDWHDRELFVPVLAMGTKPLLGMSLLDGCRLAVEFFKDGIIELENS